MWQLYNYIDVDAGIEEEVQDPYFSMGYFG
jgi:hypothetical protein